MYSETVTVTRKTVLWLHAPPTHCDLCGRKLGRSFVANIYSPLGGDGVADLRCARMFGRGYGTLYRQHAGFWCRSEG
jgi:hypothetical protein